MSPEFLFSHCLRAFITLTDLTEVIIGVDSRTVTISPSELERIIADLLDAFQLVPSGNQHREKNSLLVLLGFDLACGTGAVTSENVESVLALMTVIPIHCELCG